MHGMRQEPGRRGCEVMATLIRVNLGGEGEYPDCINQQGPWALLQSWRAADGIRTFYDLLAEGHRFVISSNLHLPFAEGSVDVVYTRSVPIDINSLHGPGVQSSEVQRILKSGGIWMGDDQVRWVKP
jgi:hypothetical protein